MLRTRILTALVLAPLVLAALFLLPPRGFGVAALVVMFIVAQFFGLWLQAFMSNASVTLFDLIGMRLRKVDARVIVLSKIQSVKAGLLNISTNDLETHYLARGRVPNVVNLAKKTPATYTMIVRHKDQPGVLACVFSKLGKVGINAQETENIIFESAEAAIARINIDKAPPAEAIESIKAGCPQILEITLVPLGEPAGV